MITVTLPQTNPILPANLPGARKRWVVIQNQSATAVALKFDGSATVLTAANGILLQPNGTAGDTICLQSTLPVGTEAENAIYAVGVDNTETLNIQTGNLS